MLQRFHRDIKNDRIRAVKSTLLSTPQIVNGVNHVTGQAALHAAIESASIDIVRALKRHGASFTDTDRDGNNGLHYVALYGRVDLLCMADDSDWRRAVVSPNLLKSTPLHTLLEAPSRNKADAAALVSTFMHCGADSVLPDAHGRTPLDLAADHPELHDLMNRLVLELPDPVTPQPDTPSASRRTSGSVHTPRTRGQRPRSPRTPSFGSSTPRTPSGRSPSPAQPPTSTSRRNATRVAAAVAGAYADNPHASLASTAATPRAGRGHRAPEQLSSPRRSCRRSAPGNPPGVNDAVPMTRRTASGHISSTDLSFDVVREHSVESLAPYEAAATSASRVASLPSQPSIPSYDAGAAAEAAAATAAAVQSRMVTLEQAVNDMQGHVVMVANSGATAMQPLEHELEDVKAAVAELSTRVDAAVTTAAADKERGDAFAHDIKKLQARASEARHMLRATEDAVREVASFVAELDERIPEGGPVAGAGGEVAAEVARLSAIVAAHKKVLERLEFAVKAQEAAGGGSGAAVDAGVEEQLTELRAEVARCAVASAALPPEAAAQLEALQRSVAGLQTRVEALPRRVDAVERSTAEVLQKALEASDTASAALVAARAVGSAQGERGQGAEEGAQGRETQQAVEARLGALQGAVAQLQGKVTELQDEQAAVAARVGAAAGMGRGGEGAENGHAAPSDSIALQQRLGRLEEATTVLSAKHQQLARQLKQQANVSSQPTTPREIPVSPRMDATTALDPELVQRAFQKLQQRIISLEQERHSQHAFNEKQAALLQMLLERVNQAERRLPPAMGSDF